MKCRVGNATSLRSLLKSQTWNRPSARRFFEHRVGRDMLFHTFLFLALFVPFIGTEDKITTFSGKWQFDEAHSSYNLTTKVIKDLPDQLKVKIPNYDVPRLLGVPRYFSTPPTLVIKVVGGRLTTSAPEWFYGWIPFRAEFLIDGNRE